MMPPDDRTLEDRSMCDDDIPDDPDEQAADRQQPIRCDYCESRTCINRAKHEGSHIFSRWNYNVGPPASDRSTPVETLIAKWRELLNAARFVMAFYEPGQTHLDTEAWKVAERGLRKAIAASEAMLAASCSRTEPDPPQSPEKVSV